MVLHKVLRRGSDHANFCQDAIVVGETEKFLYLCVFDGCSGGKDSHFASSLFGKVLDYIIKNFHITLDSELIEYGPKFIIYMMSRNINGIKKFLNLDVIELLSTIVLCTINKETKECLITAFGDGYFNVDGTEVIIKNTRFANKENGNNMPDYLAYDLDNIESYEDFENWYNSKSEIHKFENINNVSIASDGILTFKKFKDTDENVDPIEFLVKDESLMQTKNMLERKCNILQNKYHLINTDDISLIRVKF